MPRSSSVKFVSPASGEISETAVLSRSSSVKFVRLARGNTLDIIGFVRHSPSIRVSPRFNPVRLTACSSPVRAAIPRPAVSSSVKLRIASAVIAAPAGSSRASRITAANSASGIETSACTGGAVNCAKAVNNRVKVKSVNFFIWISPFVYRDQEVPPTEEGGNHRHPPSFGFRCKARDRPSPYDFQPVGAASNRAYGGCVRARVPAHVSSV